VNQHVYLVPGFFGFANLGELKYFGHVRQFLIQESARRRSDIAVHVVKLPPTASLPLRTARLAEKIAKTARIGREPVHLIGHSSGGLDCRLLVSPRVVLPTRLNVERIAAAVASIVSVATPHYGTPIASFFTGLLGQRLLQTLSLSTIYLLRFGRLPIAALLQLGGIFARLDNLAVNSALLDELFRRLLADFGVGRRRSVRRLLEEVAADQALMLQLTPEAMDVFNAATSMRPGIRYGSVVTRARPPGMRAALDAGLDPSAQTSRAIYNTIYRLAAATPAARSRRLTIQQAQALRRAYRGRIPRLTANDGVVPTQSQVWGNVLHAARADHLDIVGHFRDEARRPPHFDWLTTGSGFSRERFERVWTEVLDFLLPKP
jgi:triacylglycerol esterase/lipase EstA (alpha/beta hydrolase family)